MLEVIVTHGRAASGFVSLGWWILHSDRSTGADVLLITDRRKQPDVLRSREVVQATPAVASA